MPHDLPGIECVRSYSCRRLLGFGVLLSRLGSTVFCLLAEIHDGSDNESPAAQACSGLRLPEPFPHFLRFFFQVDDHIRVLRAVDGAKIVKMTISVNSKIGFLTIILFVKLLTSGQNDYIIIS